MHQSITSRDVKLKTQGSESLKEGKEMSVILLAVSGNFYFPFPLQNVFREMLLKLSAPHNVSNCCWKRFAFFNWPEQLQSLYYMCLLAILQLNNRCKLHVVSFILIIYIYFLCLFPSGIFSLKNIAELLFVYLFAFVVIYFSLEDDQCVRNADSS